MTMPKIISGQRGAIHEIIEEEKDGNEEDFEDCLVLQLQSS